MIYNENCLDTMSRLGSVIDLTVTSPPYDDLRTYNGYSFDFEAIAVELYRVTKPGGVCVWVVNDATKNGSETGTSFAQALFFKSLGFRLETMIWEKTGSGCLGSQTYYAQNFEYMFILSKGKPTTHNLIKDRKNKCGSGSRVTSTGLVDGKHNLRTIQLKPFGTRTNIWRINQQRQNGHPAPFPEQLVHDHMVTWSLPGDLVFDPFLGSGTTGKVAKQLGREFIGSEISSDYYQLALRNI